MRDQLKRWPYRGPIAVAEGGPHGRRQWHILEDWQHIDTVDADEAALDVGEYARRGPTAFDIDTYRILTRTLQNSRYRILPLSTGEDAP